MSEEMLNSQNDFEMEPYIVCDVKPPVDLKQERKFCSGMGMNFFLYFLIANVLQIIVAVLILVLIPDIAFTNYALYMIMLMMPMYVIGVPILWLLCKRRPAVTLEKHKMGAGKFMVLLMMCFGVMIIGNIVGMIVNAIIAAAKGSPVVNTVDMMMSSSALWANILIVGLCAPIFEELMFRKFLVDRMVRYGEATAVVVSALMFGLFHGNFSQFFYATALGFFLAYVYVKTGKLKYPIIIHMIINMSSTLMLPIIQMIDMEALANLSNITKLMMEGNVSQGLMTDTVSILMDMALPLAILLLYDLAMYGMGIAGIILLIIKRKQFTFKKGEITLPKGKRASVVWGNIGMILFTISCIVMFVVTIFS